FVCRLLHLKIISLKNPLQIGLCNKALRRQIMRQIKTVPNNQNIHSYKTPKSKKAHQPIRFL
ncbi:hypothetical protein V3528_10650, partial [Acinetobacter johnsonii]